MDVLDIWQESFDLVYDKAISIVESYKLTFDHSNGYSALDNIQKQKLLLREIDAIETEKRKMLSFRYYYNAEDREVLFAEYLNNYTEKDYDDSEILLSSIVLAGKNNFLLEKLKNFDEANVKFNLQDFLDGKVNSSVDKYFADERIDKSDYEKIRMWQADKVISIIEIEKDILIQKFHKEFSEAPDQVLLLRSRIESLDKLFDFPPGIPDEELLAIFNRLKSVFVLNTDLNDWKGALYDYTNGRFDFTEIIPRVVLPIQKEYENRNRNGTFPVLPPSLFLLALYRYQVWLEQLEKTGRLEEDGTLNKIEKAFEHAYEKGIVEAEIRKEGFLNGFNPEKQTEVQHKKRLQTEFASLRPEANELPHLTYYESAEKPETLKAAFRFQAYFSNIDTEATLLAKSLTLYHYISYIQWELDDAFGQKTLIYLKEHRSINTAVLGQLIDQIVLNREKHRQFKLKLDSYFQHFEHNYALPVDFIFLNIAEAFNDFFLECINDLSVELDKLPQTKRIQFIQSRLRKLKKDEAMDRFESRKTDKYSTLLKEYLQIEAEYLKETGGLTLLPVNRPVTLSEKCPSVCFSFEMRHKTLLEKAFQLLNTDLTSGFTDVARTPFELFISLLSSPNLLKETGGLHFRCDTRQLRYIITKIQPWFLSLTLENIERSGKFFSSRGTVIRANSLSKSKSGNPMPPKEIEKIDRIFRQLAQ